MFNKIVNAGTSESAELHLTGRVSIKDMGMISYEKLKQVFYDFFVTSKVIEKRYLKVT